MRVSLNLFRITLLDHVRFEIIEVDHPIREVRLYQNIDIQINVCQHTVLQLGWGADVAVETPELARLFSQAKDIVVAIQPVVFDTPRAACDPSHQMVLNFVLKQAFKNNQRVPPFNYVRLPAAMFCAVILAHQHGNAFGSYLLRVLFNELRHFLPSRLQAVEIHPPDSTVESCGGGLRRYP